MYRQVLRFTVGGAAVLGAGVAFAQQQPPVYCGHMWDSGWGMIFGPLWMVVILALIVGVAIAIAKRLDGGSVRSNTESLNILKNRFARGEINKEEFEERRRVIGD